MEVSSKLLTLYNNGLIRPMFISVILLGIIGKVFSDKIHFKRTLAIAAWIMMVYALINLLHFLIVLYIEKFPLLRVRFSGQYAWANWLMFLGATLIPLLLIFKKLRHNFLIVLLVSMPIGCGWLIERIVIYSVSQHRDYVTMGVRLSSIVIYSIAFIIRGALLAFLIIAVSILWKNSKQRIEARDAEV